MSSQKVKYSEEGVDNAILATTNGEQCEECGEDVNDEGNLKKHQQRVEINPTTTDWVQPVLGAGNW